MLQVEKNKDLRLLWVALTVIFLFLIPFIIRIVREWFFGLDPNSRTDDLFVLFVFIPYQILILALSIYVNMAILIRWSKSKNKKLNIISMFLTFPIILSWIVFISILIFRALTI